MSLKLGSTVNPLSRCVQLYLELDTEECTPVGKLTVLTEDKFLQITPLLVDMVAASKRKGKLLKWLTRMEVTLGELDDGQEGAECTFGNVLPHIDVEFCTDVTLEAISAIAYDSAGSHREYIFGNKKPMFNNR